MHRTETTPTPCPRFCPLAKFLAIAIAAFVVGFALLSAGCAPLTHQRPEIIEMRARLDRLDAEALADIDAQIVRAEATKRETLDALEAKHARENEQVLVNIAAKRAEHVDALNMWETTCRIIVCGQDRVNEMASLRSAVAELDRDAEVMRRTDREIVRLTAAQLQDQIDALKERRRQREAQALDRKQREAIQAADEEAEQRARVSAALNSFAESRAEASRPQPEAVKFYDGGKRMTCRPNAIGTELRCEER